KDKTSPLVKVPYEYPKKVKLRSYNPVTRGHSGQIRKAVEELLKAKRPVIYAGGGVIQGEASKHLTDLAHKLDFPVTNTLMGLGAFPATDKQFLGMLGMHGTYEANMAMHNADLILALGARFDDRVTNDTKKFCPGATIIHVDVDPATISKNVRADVPIVGPVSQVLEEMVATLDEIGVTPDEKALARWWEEIGGWREYHGLRYELDPNGPMKPQQVVQALYKATNGDAYVTSDVGQHQMFAAQFYKFDKPRYWINSGGLGTMGFGLPAAMGVQFAFPDAMVACVTGEGSIQMNIQELSTCLQYGLPIKIININNQALGMVRQWQDMQYGGRHSQSYMDSLPDFVKLAESYGHVGIRVDKHEDLDKAMEEAFALKDRLVFMDIYVDPSEHVYPMHIADGAIRDMWLSKTERT
ncbi:MAG: biosynthetic-type acetolactate synthase large subunit, partial [Alcanivoracaceae bacterium]